MAYDTVRGVTVLFGGNFDLRDTWEWDGVNWIQRSPTSRPSGRYGHSMAYDSTKSVTLLFGGLSGLHTNDDTWEWDGTNWTQRNPLTDPVPRYFHALVYDSTRGAIVAYGGTNYSFNDDTDYYLGDTWEFGLCPLCDLNGDGGVDGTDFSAFLLAFGYCTGEPGFNPAADLDQDGCVTLIDYQRWLQCFRAVTGNSSATAPTPSDAGDLNADGQADGLDIQAFVERLLTPALVNFRDSFIADFTGDGRIDSADIPSLTEALLR